MGETANKKAMRKLNVVIRAVLYALINDSKKKSGVGVLLNRCNKKLHLKSFKNI